MINLWIFLPELDSILSLYPRQTPPEEFDCPIRCRIGYVDPGGRMRADAWRQWWEFDAATDLPALGADVRDKLEHNALAFFDNLSTRTGIHAWLREHPALAFIPERHRIALAAYAGAPALAQEWLDTMLARDSTGPDWYRNWLNRDAAHLADRLGLACPAPTDTPAVTAVFRVAADMTPQDRHSAFHHLEYKFRQYVELWRTLLPVQDANQLYQTVRCTSDTCTVAFYGTDPEYLLDRLRRAFDRLSELFADITFHVDPALRAT